MEVGIFQSSVRITMAVIIIVVCALFVSSVVQAGKFCFARRHRAAELSYKELWGIGKKSYFLLNE